MVTAGNKVRCLVPGCRRHVALDDPDDTEGICSKHWPLLPRQRRAIYKTRRRELRLSLERWEIDEAKRLAPIVARLWRWLRRRAIERSIGI